MQYRQPIFYGMNISCKSNIDSAEIHSMMNRFKVRMMRFFVKQLIKVSWWRKLDDSVIRTIETIAVEHGEIRAYIYSPEASEPLPVIVFYHGGGFVVGDVDAYDPICRDLCQKTGHIVVSIDYRLAPEFPFPTAANDCLSAFKWVFENIKKLGGDVDKLFVAGDSAGGNLATVTAIQVRDLLPAAIKGQILIYPVTDHYTAETQSYRENGTGQGLSRKQMIWFWDQYLSNGLTQHDLATPLTVDDLHGLPPALVITAEFDPLRDEGIAYAEKLSHCHVEVQHSMYKGQKHGFVGTFGPSKSHERALTEISLWLDKI